MIYFIACKNFFVFVPATSNQKKRAFFVLPVWFVTAYSCVYISDPFPPRPTCQWFKDGVKLTEKSHQINNKERTLSIKNASPEDNGLYYCCAKNAAGHVCSNSNFTLNIIGGF